MLTIFLQFHIQHFGIYQHFEYVTCFMSRNCYDHLGPFVSFFFKFYDKIIRAHIRIANHDLSNPVNQVYSFCHGAKSIAALMNAAATCGTMALPMARVLSILEDTL